MHVIAHLLVPASLAITAAAYLWKVARPRADARVPGPSQVAAFLVGLLILAGALTPRLEALASQRFSAHMLQHLLLVSFAPPLLVLGAPLAPLASALGSQGRLVPRSVRHREAAGTTAGWSSGAVLAAYTVVLWTWHAPALYDAALARTGVHVVEHATLLATALLFWWTVLRRVRRDMPALGLLTTFLASLQMIALGALLTFASRPLYAIGRDTPGALADQQLGGGLMWILGGLPLVLAAGVLFWSWFAEPSPTTPESVR